MLGHERVVHADVRSKDVPWNVFLAQSLLQNLSSTRNCNPNGHPSQVVVFDKDKTLLHHRTLAQARLPFARVLYNKHVFDATKQKPSSVAE